MLHGITDHARRLTTFAHAGLIADDDGATALDGIHGQGNSINLQSHKRFMQGLMAVIAKAICDEPIDTAMPVLNVGQCFLGVACHVDWCQYGIVKPIRCRLICGLKIVNLLYLGRDVFGFMLVTYRMTIALSR